MKIKASEISDFSYIRYALLRDKKAAYFLIAKARGYSDKLGRYNNSAAYNENFHAAYLSVLRTAYIVCIYPIVKSIIAGEKRIRKPQSMDVIKAADSLHEDTRGFKEKLFAGSPSDKTDQIFKEAVIRTVKPFLTFNGDKKMQKELFAEVFMSINRHEFRKRKQKQKSKKRSRQLWG